jgi:hypothetical protein
MIIVSRNQNDSLHDVFVLHMHSFKLHEVIMRIYKFTTKEQIWNDKIKLRRKVNCKYAVIYLKVILETNE